jgi:antitoxin ParD1/3/4
MTQLSLTLPKSLHDFVETRVAHGGFGTAEEYLRELIRRDRNQRRMRLEETLLEALDSGESILAPEDIAPGRLVAALKADLATAGK